METSCDKTGNAPEGALFTETRMPVETHLMSNVSLGRAALSHMAPGKTRLRFVPWSLVQGDFKCRSHDISTPVGALDSFLLDIQLHTFAFMWSDIFIEPQERHHLQFKISLISISQNQIKLVHVSIGDHGFDSTYQRSASSM